MVMAKQVVQLMKDPAGQHMPYACASGLQKMVFS